MGIVREGRRGGGEGAGFPELDEVFELCQQVGNLAVQPGQEHRQGQGRDGGRNSPETLLMPGGA